ncbi:oligosaccharide biosynthesis protein Alg14 like-domain-containing protein [Xylaria grammica]|nr:oligosaccharide biosynthesis protein Alg14 like-domain-containing protein [Xylaria grammica]
MDTNRDRVVQATIGSALLDLLKNGIFLFIVMGCGLLILSILIDVLSKPHVTGNTLGATIIIIFVGGYLILKTDGGMVRELSTHYVLMICGSGGHTAEMIQMVERSICSEKSSHRRWAVGKDDEKSYDKVLAFENRLLDRFSRHDLDSGTFDIMRFRRARYVHQSWLTTPFTTILSLLDIIRILATPPHQRSIPVLQYPGVVVTNGPGTGFLFLLVARVLRLSHLVPTSHMRTIYVESWARVKSLSLTGKLIRSLKLADLFIVQAPALAGHNNVLAENLLALPEQPRFPFNA